jgi:hypothetical protein
MTLYPVILVRSFIIILITCLLTWPTRKPEEGGGGLCCTCASCVWRILTCLVRVSSNNEAHAISLLIQSSEDGKKGTVTSID